MTFFFKDKKIYDLTFFLTIGSMM